MSKNIETMTKEEIDKALDAAIKEKMQEQLTETEKKRESKLDFVKETAKELSQKVNRVSDFIKKEEAEEKLELDEEVVNKEVKFNYLDEKKAIAELEKEQIKINAELNKEKMFVKKFGANEHSLTRINELQEQYNVCITSQLEKVKAINQHEQELKVEVKEKATNVKEKVNQMIDTLKKSTIDKVVVGLATLRATTDRIKEANKAVMTKTALAKDAYSTILIEDLEKYNRKMISLNYSIDKMAVNKLEKQYERLEQTYQKKANIKDAFKNFGKAFTGKEITVGEQKITEKEQERLNYLESQIKALKAEMKNYEKEFNKSKSLSIENLKSAKELREVNNVKESKGLNERLNNIKDVKIEKSNNLDKRIEAAKMESKQEKEKNAERKAPTVEKDTKDVGERERE